MPEQEGSFSEPLQPLHEATSRLLAQRNIEQLYAHQVSALVASRLGQDRVVVTGTASGKTLAYNLPILETVFSARDARALYLFPTKALAQDQLKGLLEIVADNPSWKSAVRPGVYEAIPQLPSGAEFTTKQTLYYHKFDPPCGLLKTGHPTRELARKGPTATLSGGLWGWVLHPPRWVMST